MGGSDSREVYKTGNFTHETSVTNKRIDLVVFSKQQSDSQHDIWFPYLLRKLKMKTLGFDMASKLERFNNVFLKFNVC